MSVAEKEVVEFPVKSTVISSLDGKPVSLIKNRNLGDNYVNIRFDKEVKKWFIISEGKGLICFVKSSALEVREIKIIKVTNARNAVIGEPI
jgi:transcription antitermination factor NusG